MSHVPVVENPRRRRGKKHRTYTAKQRMYGFGGKKRRVARAANPRRRRRRNPTSLAALNPRRRRRSRVSYPRRRRYRNPRGSKGLFGLPIPGVDLKGAAYVGLGMLSTRMVPNLIAKVWPGIPRVGYMGYAVDAGAGVLVGMVVKMLTKDSAAAGKVVAGAIGMVLFNLFNAEVAPRIGLSGLSGELAAFGDLRGLGHVGGNGSRFSLSHPVQTGY